MITQNKTKKAKSFFDQKSVVAAATLSIGLGFFPSNSHSAEVYYQLTQVQGNVYQYLYTVFNDGSLPGGAPIEGFQIQFPDTNNLAIFSPPALSGAWDEQILAQSLTDPAAYDALALTGGIPSGNSLSSFIVQFQWTGSGTPGAQYFEIYDPNTFVTLGSGSTAPVPLPPALMMMASALGGLVSWLRLGRRTPDR